jgi:NADH dehydrogenase [ubiquinone] 1 alpha subcomplex assembly factor 1
MVMYESNTLLAVLVSLMGALSLPMDAGPWREINDSVMGGVSSSAVQNEAGVLVFSGTLSLENRGGFASARRPVETPPADTDRIQMEVRGDGRRYQFRIRQDDRFDGVAWSQSFVAERDWQTISLPLSGFVPVFRGTRVTGAGPVEATRIRQVGLMLADKTPGPFRLEIRSIEFLSPGAADHAGD